MAPSTAHLLGLPRELRDMIYSHLSRDIVLEWEWKVDTKFQGRLKRIDICLHVAPIAHVLRIHPQVYAEYKEAACFSKLSATVTINLLAPVQDMRTIRVGSLTHVRNALAHVWYATMSFDYMAHPESKRGPKHQEILEDMIDDFTSMAPNLSVFRYAIHQRLLIHQPGASLRSALTHRDFSMETYRTLQPRRTISYRTHQPHLVDYLYCSPERVTSSTIMVSWTRTLH
jgi:hypothetical protein